MEKKIISVLIGSFLILSLLPMGAAETTLNFDEEEIDVELLDSDYDADYIDEPIYVGEQNVEFGVRVFNNNETDDLEDSNLTMKHEGDWIEDWWIDRVDDEATIPADGGEHEFEIFRFNVSETAEPGTYELTAELNFTLAGDYYEEDVGVVEVTVANVQDMDIEIDIVDLDDPYIGEKNVEFGVEVTNNEDYALEDCNVTFSHEGNWIEDWSVSEIGPIDVGPGETENFESFQLNISGTEADPEVIYELTATLEFTFRGTTFDDYFETFEAEVERNLDVGDAEDILWPGEDFQEMEIEIENVGDVIVSDIYLTLSGLPDGVSLRDDTARYPGELLPPPVGDVGETGTVYFRVDVDTDVQPGTYEIDYDLEAVREDDEDVDIEEYGTLEMDIGFAPIIEAEIEDELVVEQGTTSLTFDVTFENTGNVDLSEIHVSMIEQDPFFIKAVDHYEYGEGVTEPEIPVGDLDVGEEETMEFKIGLHRNLQHGNHRLLFEWNGYFFNDGSFDQPTQYQYVEVSWEDDAPRTAVLNIDGEDVDDDWIGPEAILEVEMIDIDFTGYSGDIIELDGDITNQVIEVEITNHELVDFKDVEAQLMVGEGTPFYNPADRDRGYVEMNEPAQDLDSLDSATFTFTVDINTDFVSERIGEGAHAYEATVMITQAVNVDTNEEFTDIEVDATVGLSGYGPNLVVEAELSDHHLEPGENFTLEYTIRNEGDETARETTVSMIPDLYENDWEIIDGYIRALASSSEKYSFEFGEIPEDVDERSKNTSHLDINLLGVEDGEDIVDLHMYIEGALSAPRPHIWNLYVGEINPGDEYTVSFEMVASEHTQLGQPYQEDIEIEWMDANGATHTETYPTTISLAEAPEEVQEPAEIAGMDAAVFGVILVIIILIIALAVSLMSRKTDGEEKEETFEEMEEEPGIEEEPEETLEPDDTEEPEDIDEESLFEEEPSDVEEPEEEEW